MHWKKIPWKMVAAFVLIVIWDWIATAEIRFIANKADWALFTAALTTGMWWTAASLAGSLKFLPAVMIGSILGTWLGIHLF